MERFWGDIANSTPGFPYVTAVTETVIAHIHYHRTLHKTHLVSGNCLQLPHLEHRGSFQWSLHSRRHGYWNRPLYMAMFAGLIIVPCWNARRSRRAHPKEISPPQASTLNPQHFLYSSFC